MYVKTKKHDDIEVSLNFLVVWMSGPIFIMVYVKDSTETCMATLEPFGGMPEKKNGSPQLACWLLLASLVPARN